MASTDHHEEVEEEVSRFTQFTPVLPVITVYRNGVREQKNHYRPTSKYDMMYARWLCRDAKIGTSICYHHISNFDYREHCLDFIITRTENGWQPYVSSYYLDDSNMPIGYHFNLYEYLYEWKKIRYINVKKAIEQKVTDELLGIDLSVDPDTTL
jgi:hypothetical protein